MSVGLFYPILNQSSPVPIYINSVWFNDLIQFMATHNIKIITKKHICNFPQKVKDKFIMGNVMRLHLPTFKLIQIDEFRIHLQLSYLSNLIMSNSKDDYPEFPNERKPK